MRTLARYVSHSPTLGGGFYFFSNAEPMRGQYENIVEFQEALWRYNRNAFSLSIIELVGFLKKELFTKRHSFEIKKFCDNTMNDFVNFWTKPPEIQAAFTRGVIINLEFFQKGENAQYVRELSGYVSFLKEFYNKYLLDFEVYKNPEIKYLESKIIYINEKG